MGKYRRKDSFTSKDPAKRAKQLANLPQYQKNGESIIATPDELKNMDIITFAEQQLRFKLRPAQAVILKVIYGMSLSDAEMDIYKTLTKREIYKAEEAVEAVLALGARSGKSTMVSIMALYEAICRADKWRSRLCPGELGYIVVVATRQKQAEDIIGRNCARLLQGSLVEYYLRGDPLKAEIELINDMKIIALPCNSTAGRGIPICCLIFDEIAHFFTEGARADVDIYNSLSPRLAQFTRAKTFMISTPNAKQGLFFEWFDEGFEVPGRATFHASTLFMNPDIDKEYLKRQELRDPDSYAREFDAEFADQFDAYFPAEKLKECMQISNDLKPQEDIRYFCAIDQSGLSGNDRFGLCIAHRKPDGTVWTDVVRAYATKNINEILANIKEITTMYNIHKVSRDRYGAGWVQQSLEGIGLEVELRPLPPEIYANAKGLMMAGRLVLSSHPELKAGLINTFGYYGKNNSFSVNHDKHGSGHADMADATIAAIFAASEKSETTGLALSLDYDVQPRGDERVDPYSSFRSPDTQRKPPDPARALVMGQLPGSDKDEDHKKSESSETHSGEYRLGSILDVTDPRSIGL